MKHFVPFVRGLAGKALLPLLLAATFPALGQDAAPHAVPQIARVLRLRGAARFSTDNKTWQKIKEGDFLLPGSMVQTAAKSVLDLQLGMTDAGAKTRFDDDLVNGRRGATANLVRMFESSVLAIDTLSMEGAVEKIELDLRVGGIMGSVTKLSDGSTYEVRLPNGVAGSRGATYMLRASGKTAVLTGGIIVVIAGADGAMVTKLVSANHEFDPATGQITELAAPAGAPAGEAPTSPNPATPPASAFPWPQYPARKF